MVREMKQKEEEVNGRGTKRIRQFKIIVNIIDERSECRRRTVWPTSQQRASQTGEREIDTGDKIYRTINNTRL